MNLGRFIRASCRCGNPNAVPKLLSPCRLLSLSGSSLVRKDQLDFSNFPTLDDNDLEEQFIKGGGPGGQKVNKAVNCVQLKHIPTGIVVKIHHSRFQLENRKIARETMLERLDEFYNGEMSVANQRRTLLEVKSRKTSSKRSKVAKLKEAWKEREGIT